jgi:hypothetical protein
MTPRLVLTFVLTAAAFHVVSAEAQVITRPPRVYRGLFGAGAADVNRWNHDVTLSGNVFGGYDNNLTPVAGDGATTGGNTEGTGGYLGYAAAQLAYSASRSTKSIELAARGMTNSYGSLGLEPVYGGEASARLATPLGTRNNLSAFERYSDNPMFAPDVPLPPTMIDGPVAPATAPLANNTTAYLVRRSQTLDGNVTLQRRVTRRTTLVIGGSHGATRHDDGLGDSDMVGGMFNYGWSIGRSTVAGAYHYSSAETQSPPMASRPMASHNVMLNYSIGHRITRSRQLAISLGGGATQVNTISSFSSEPLSYSTPAGHANVRLDLTRSWNVALDYARGVSVIEGVSLDSFVTDNVSLRSGGNLGARGDLAMSANWVTGRAGAEGAGVYDSYTGIVQLQLAVNRWIDSTMAYTYYAYRLEGVTVITPGLVTNLNRHAVRAGLNFRLPLYGRYLGRRQGGDN